MFMFLIVPYRRTEGSDEIRHEHGITRYCPIKHAIVNNICMAATLISVALVTVL
jgi:hypothetical protein